MKKFPSWLKALSIILIVVAVISAVGIAFASVQLKQALQWDEGTLQGNESTLLYDNEEQMYQSLHGTENRVYVSLDEISPYLQDCFVASEDIRFYEINS